MVGEVDYVELGLACANVCEALDREINRGRMDQPSQPVLSAIEQLTMLVCPAMATKGNSLTKPSIAELWQRSRGTSLGGVNEMLSLSAST